MTQFKLRRKGVPMCFRNVFTRAVFLSILMLATLSACKAYNSHDLQAVIGEVEFANKKFRYLAYLIEDEGEKFICLNNCGMSAGVMESTSAQNIYPACPINAGFVPESLIDRIPDENDRN